MKLTKRNDGLFPNLLNTFYDDDWFKMPDTFKMGTSAPAVNILDHDEHFEVDLAVPGMRKEDFTIDLEKNILTISAENKFENEEKDEKENYTRREFNYSAFKRSFTLPDTVEGEKISATYNNGVLSITVPKKEEAKPKPPIAIEVS